MALNKVHADGDETKNNNNKNKQTTNKQTNKQKTKQKPNNNRKTKKTIPLKSKPRDHANKTVPEHLFLGVTVDEVWQTLVNNIRRIVSRNVFLQN